MVVSAQALTSFITDQVRKDQALFDQLIEHFTQDLRDFKMSQSDIKQVQELAHKLKSSCLYFGAVELESLFSRIELDCRSHQLEGIEQKIESAINLIEPTMELIQKISSEFFQKEKQSA
jgi:HPt (histidine-containing phosphotransfer) domain-containing protein